jgi:hypothetical protein
VRFSIVGLLLGLGYLVFPILCAWRVVSRDSFGGIFSQEFPLFVVTLPCSPIAEWWFKSYKHVRLVVYALCALVNAAILYFLGMGLQRLITTR